MNKKIILSLVAFSTLQASEITATESIQGLFIGNIDNAWGARNSISELHKDYYNYGRDNAIIGCLHGRPGSDASAYYDCTSLMQVYKYKDGSGNPRADNANFRDNVYCMAYNDDNLGKNKIPSADEYLKSINKININDDLYVKVEENKLNPSIKYDTNIYKYSLGNYQESYKDFGINSTGRLIVLAKNQSDKYNPFSFYISDNINMSGYPSDFKNFINNYFGIQRGKMIPGTGSKRSNMYQSWSVLAARSITGGYDRGNWCNEIWNWDNRSFRNGSGCGDSSWEKQSAHGHYVRFFHSLWGLGYKFRPSIASDHVMDSDGAHFGGIKNEYGNIVPYGISGSITGHNEFSGDDNIIKNYPNGYEKTLYYANYNVSKITEAITLKNISLYGTNEFNNKDNVFPFFNKNTEEGTNITSTFGNNNTIGKCYFINLQYYGSKNKKPYEVFEAMQSSKLMWNKPNNEFLQNYVKSIDNQYAIANYSIDRTNIYSSQEPYETHSFTLNTRPTSFRGNDINLFGNSENGVINARYYLVFYPDANGTKMKEITNPAKTIIKSKISNIQEYSNDLAKTFADGFYVVNKDNLGENANIQLGFTFNEEELDENRTGFANKGQCNIDTKAGCENMEFNFSDFKYTIYKLDKLDTGFKINSAGTTFTAKDAQVKQNQMALRVDENLLEAIGYKDKESILLVLELSKAKYSDNRPFFETNSKTIINAKNVEKFVVIISDIQFNGKKLDFGSIWNNDEEDKVPNMNNIGNKVGFAPNEIYTRVIGQPVFIGIKNNNPKLNLSESIITFDVKDKYGNPINNMKFFENGVSEMSKSTELDYIIDKNKFNSVNTSNAYPYKDGVLRLDDLKVGQYKVCYNIYSKTQITTASNEEIKNNEKIDVPVKVSACSNIFSVRPAFVEYQGNTKFIAGENALGGGKATQFIATLKDKNKNAIDTNEIFTLTKANLIVEDSKNNPYTFNLNASNHASISSTNTLAFNKQNNNSYLINGVMMNFPFSTDANLELLEGGFTKNDSLLNVCIANSKDNKIDRYGKVGCLIPNENILKIDFTSTQEYKLGEFIRNNPNTSTKIFFKSNPTDGNSLTIPFVFNHKGLKDAGSLEYVYHKFNNDHILDYDLKLDNKDTQANDRYLINLSNKYASDTYTKTISPSNIKINQVLALKDKLNVKFDEQLANLAAETDNINKVIENYKAKADEISLDLELAYTKYKKALDNKAISNNILAKPNVAEFELLQSSKVNIDTKPNNFTRGYSFIFTGLGFKDTKVENADSITLKPSDVEFYYINKFDKKSIFTPSSPTYKKPADEIIKELSFNADYASKFKRDSKTGDLTITLTPENAKKQYIKEIVTIGGTNDLHGGKFSIEFVNK